MEAVFVFTEFDYIHEIPEHIKEAFLAAGEALHEFEAMKERELELLVQEKHNSG